MSASLQTIARVLGGEVTAGHIVCPGPGHSPRDRSLSVKIKPDGDFIVHSFAGDDWADCRDHVKAALGIGRAPAETPIRRTFIAPQDDRHRRIEQALAIWRDARDPHGTPVETYLARRGIALPLVECEDLKWHPVCPFAGTRTGAMVALIRDVATGDPIGIHRTALSLDGLKIEIGGKDRMILGQASGGVVCLSPWDSVNYAVGIGEGIETTLSLHAIPEFGSTPAWASLTAQNVVNFPALSGVETLWIAVDNDPPGIKAAEVVRDRWTAAGREVFIVKAKATGADLNDIVKGVRHG
jgi:putative DNA primase/helicase